MKSIATNKKLHTRSPLFARHAKGAQRYDLVILACVLGLAIIGVLFVYSASWYSAQLNIGDRFYYLKKQAIGAVAGTCALILCSRIDLDVFKKIRWILLLVSVITLSLVFIPGIGLERYGARRWIGFGSFSFQPSELSKLALVCFSASYLSSTKVRLDKLMHILPVFVLGGVLCVLIILEPNMSVTMCVGILTIAMLFIGGARLRNVMLCLLPLIIAVPVLIMIEPYRLERLSAFLDPWASPKDEGYQLIQSLYALGNGGWFGVGLLNSRQKYLFLPFAESDFILSVIGEETGLIGILIVFLLFITLIARGVKACIRCDDRFSSLLGGGICAIIAIQTLINVAVVSGSIPPTGIPLPFISYGGTATVIFMAEAGILLNISSRNTAYASNHL